MPTRYIVVSEGPFTIDSGNSSETIPIDTVRPDPNSHPILFVTCLPKDRDPITLEIKVNQSSFSLSSPTVFAFGRNSNVGRTLMDSMPLRGLVAGRNTVEFKWISGPGHVEIRSVVILYNEL